MKPLILLLVIILTLPEAFSQSYWYGTVQNAQDRRATEQAVKAIEEAKRREEINRRPAQEKSIREREQDEKWKDYGIGR